MPLFWWWEAVHVKWGRNFQIYSPYQACKTSYWRDQWGDYRDHSVHGFSDCFLTDLVYEWARSEHFIDSFDLPWRARFCDLCNHLHLTLTLYFVLCYSRIIIWQTKEQNILSSSLDGFHRVFWNLRGSMWDTAKMVQQGWLTFGDISSVLCRNLFFEKSNFYLQDLTSEDQELSMRIIQTPPGGTLERTNLKVAQRTFRKIAKKSWVDLFSLIGRLWDVWRKVGDQMPVLLSYKILKPWSERQHSVNRNTGELEEESKRAWEPLWNFSNRPRFQVFWDSSWSFYNAF